MKIIIRNRNKNIETVSLASKEEMVWITPEQFTEITKDAAKTAIEFMKRNPQFHEVKFSVLPQMDDEEDEDEYNACPVDADEGGRASVRDTDGNIVYDTRDGQQSENGNGVSE